MATAVAVQMNGRGCLLCSRTYARIARRIVTIYLRHDTSHGDDLTIVGIFSGLPHPPRETWIPLSTEDPVFSQTGLKTSSVIKAERIAVIEQSIVVRKLGSLTPAKMDKVKRAIKIALKLD